MKKILSLLHTYKFYAVLISTVLIFSLTQNYLVSVLAQKYLKEFGVEYSKIEGSLLEGIILHDIQYTDAIGIKRLQVNYNLLYFLRPSPKINKIKIQDLSLDISKLPSPENNETATPFISFTIANIELSNTKVIAMDETLEFDLKAKGFYYHESVDIDTLSVDLKSSYANALIKGSVVSNKFKGDASVALSQGTSKEYLSFLKSTPKALNIKIEATRHKALLSTKLERLSLKDDENLSIEDADIKLTYFLEDDTLEAEASYKASYLEFETSLHQTFALRDNKQYTSKIKARITKQAIELPFKSIEADVFGDENSIQANMKAGLSDCNISSKDYKSFSINVDDAYFKAEGKFEFQTSQEIFEALISPKLKNKFYKDYPLELISPIKLIYKNNIQTANLYLDANLLHATLSYKENHLDGSGTFGSSSFSLAGEVKPNTDTKIHILTKTPSIKKFISELKLSAKGSKTLHEGEAEIHTTLHFNETFSMKNDIEIPRYTLKTESKKSDVIEDIFLSTTYMDRKLTINNYHANYMEHKLYSNKPSTLLIDENANIIIKEFWFQESLYASGFIDTSKKELDIAIKSDKFTYSFNETGVSVQTDLKASVNFSGIQKIKGNIALLDVTVNKEAVELPFKKMNAEILGDAKNLKIKIQSDSLDFHVTSKDYEHFGIDADDDYFKLEGKFSLEQNKTHAWARVHPKLENEFYKNYPLKLFSPINIHYKSTPEGEEINIDANLLQATLFNKNSDVNGFGTLGSSTFTLSTKTDENNDIKVSINTKTPSINKLLSELQLSVQEGAVHDGEADINSTITFNNNFSIKNDIHMPWYTLTVDSDSTYLVENISLETEYSDKNITLKRYDAKYMQHRFYADKPSVFVIDENENIEIKKFWIFDNLLATGFINTAEKEIQIALKSDKFTYEAKDANLSAKADLRLSVDSLGKQKIEGDITLLDGVISYVPPQDYVVTDKDIIVTQDVKTDYTSDRFINVSIHSLRPISYQTKDIDIKVSPDIAIYQEVGMPLKLLGIVTLNSGKITAGDKEFVFDTSEVYFSGENPIDPQLNLNLHYYTLDYIDIEIFISNTLSSPIVIFSSKPAMSQNDIMSYILFGEPASSLFESSDGSAKVSVSSLLLGTGLKQIFNDTTGVRVDTFNILSNKEGTLGYEIGTRFSKKIRILYRSDTVSSMIVQYSLSKSMRVDVDVDESGQGVNIIYVKDF